MDFPHSSRATMLLPLCTCYLPFPLLFLFFLCSISFLSAALLQNPKKKTLLDLPLKPDYAMNASLSWPGIEVQWVCQNPTKILSSGVIGGDNPFDYSLPTLMAQLSITALVNAFLQYILTPLGLSSFVSMILVGFAMGPSFWGDSHPIIANLYTKKSFYVVNTFGFFGCILFTFVIGIKMDLGMVKRTGKRAVAVGFLAFFLPLALNSLVALILARTMELKFTGSLYVMAAFQSVSTFHVISCLLADLKLLDSEVGKLATSATMISSMCSYVLVVVTIVITAATRSFPGVMLWMFLCSAFALVIIFHVFRPIMCWMVRNTPEGKPIKESYVLSVFMMLMACAIYGEFMGQQTLIGAICMGMAVPDGPPLGSALVQKLETFSSWILLPTYFVYGMADVNILTIHPSIVTIACCFIVTTFTGKFLGGMLPSLYCKMPPVEAISVGLVMSAQGISDILLLQLAISLKVMASFSLLDIQTYSTMVVGMVILTSITTIIVKIIYDPSTKYACAGNMTIQHSNSKGEFRLLACVCHQDNTASMINLIEISNPTARSPLCCYVVHLMELAGRFSPLLIHHEPEGRKHSRSSYSSNIIKSFRLYEQSSYGHVITNLFTAISPFVSIHEQVCRLALQKLTHVVIIPFHKQWRLHGMEEIPELRAVNHSIIELAPCSVGILLDRGKIGDSDWNRTALYRVGVVFIHGKDDREALAYAMRMCEHPDVSVTVVRVTEPGQEGRSSLHMALDDEIISQFKMSNVGRTHNSFREKDARDSLELISLIRSLQNSFDLIMVGRAHDCQSSLFMGLTDWNEFPELGLVGDMLASSDSQCLVSVLVVQQKGFGFEGEISSTNYCNSDLTKDVRIQFDETEQWPVIEVHKGK